MSGDAVLLNLNGAQRHQVAPAIAPVILQPL